MQRLIAVLFLAALACSLQACTSKSANLTPLVTQQIRPMDGNGGGPSSNCGEQACPDPTPTP